MGSDKRHRPSLLLWSGHEIAELEPVAAVETVPGKLSGQPVIRHSRMRPDDLVANKGLGTEWLAEHHSLPGQVVRDVLSFYERHTRPLAS
jgi:uncharacterized protein (DUF433 family)